MNLPLALIPWFRLDGFRLPGGPSGFAIRPFGVLVLAGVVLGARVALRRGRRLGLDDHALLDFILHVVVAGFVGSHLVERVMYSQGVWSREPWDLLMPWRSMSSFGGFLSGVGGAALWKWRRGGGMTGLLDQVAFGMPVGWLFGRTGCFIVHDHPGVISHAWLAVDAYQFPGLPVGPRHDLGLYEAIWSAGAVALFAWLDRRPRPRGFFVALIGLLYAPVRFLLDFLREGDPTYHGWTFAQYLCVVTVLVCAWQGWRCMRAAPDPTPQAAR